MRQRVVIWLAVVAASLAALVGAGASAAAVSTGPREPLVVGGWGARPGEFPWMVRIDLVAPDGVLDGFGDGQPDIWFWCGGTLVGERWVLTAGHCVTAFGQVIGTPGFAPGLRFQVVVGEIGLDGFSDPLDVFEVEPDDVFTAGVPSGTANGDIALLRLPRAAGQQAIRIVGAGQDAGPLTAAGVQAVVAGWGAGSPDGSLSPALLQTELPIVSDRDCAIAYPSSTGGFEFVAGTMVCAFAPGRDTCFGDSGGPLLVRSLAGWIQVGITSWGDGSCATRPGVYGRLSGLAGFILRTVSNDREAPGGLPDAATGAAPRVKQRSATVTGTVDPNGLATAYVIEIGTNRRYTKGHVEAYAGAGSLTRVVAATFARLKPGTTYHYRVTAMNVAGVAEGPDRTFRTTPSP